mmetsp:Transcript_60655/g.130190  ORF Transcript_60655/g.130190 Transcript_60655/m.130190 type:complete len:241 (+) Transcript_60655:2513-3235(+)
MVHVPRADCLRASELESHLLVGRNLRYVAHSTPAGILAIGELCVGGRVQAQPQLVARHEASLVILLCEVEVGDPLLVQADVPPDDNVLLGLRLFHPLVIVGLHLHEGREDMLVLVCILEMEHHGLGVILKAWACLALEVLQGGIRVRLPELLKLVDLRCSDLPGAHLLLRIWDLHEPREKRTVLYEGLPLTEVPIRVLQRVVRQTNTAQEHNHGVALCGDESEEEDVTLATVVALQNNLS